MLIKSIRWRFQAWLAFLLVCILCGFGATAYQLHRRNRFDQIDEALERRLSAVAADMRMRLPMGDGPPRRFEGGPDGGRMLGGPERIGGPDGPGNPDRPGGRPHFPPPDEFLGPPGEFRPWSREIRLSTATQLLFEPAETNGFYYVIWSGRGPLMTNSINAPLPMPPPRKLDDAARDFQTRTRGDYREVFRINGLGDTVLVGRLISADLSTTRRFAWWLFGAGAGVLAFGVGGGWWLASRALRPVEEISRAAVRIADGNLSERISVPETDSELGRLATVLNSTFARLEASFSQQRQFTADASHELRTPLTVIMTEAQSTLARERSPAEYRETIEDCLGTARQMARLTESLLQLARLDAGQEILERTTFDLAELARECARNIHPMAVEHGVSIQCDLRPAEGLGEPDRIAQVVTNLLSNAIYYGKPQGGITVSCRKEPGRLVLSVADDGCGIAAEDLPHVFERFYRADKSRGRSGGRSGLGLAISKAIIEAHGGRIEVESKLGVGSTFSIFLPERGAVKAS